MNEYEKFRQQTEEEHNAKIVDEAKQYNQRLEERLTKIEHSLCVIAQAMSRVSELMIEHLDEGDKQITFYSKALVELVADLQPKLSSVSITLPDNGCNDPEPNPKDGYGWSEKE